MPRVHRHTAAAGRIRGTDIGSARSVGFGSHVRFRCHHRGEFIVVERRRIAFVALTLALQGQWTLVRTTTRPLHSHPPAATGPLPPLGPLDESPLDGISVHVHHFSHEFVVIADVAIETAAGLPKAWGAAWAEDLEEGRSAEFFPACEDPDRGLEFDRLEDGGHRGFGSRVHQDVHVLGHDDPGVEGEAKFLAGFIERVDEDVACTGLAEEWQTTEAGERDETDAVFAAVELLSMRLWFVEGKGHGEKIQEDWRLVFRGTDLGLARSVGLGWRKTE